MARALRFKSGDNFKCSQCGRSVKMVGDRLAHRAGERKRGAVFGRAANLSREGARRNRIYELTDAWRTLASWRRHAAAVEIWHRG